VLFNTIFSNKNGYDIDRIIVLTETMASVVWTPEMILAERQEKRKGLYHMDWFHVNCPCYGCRTFYDPTGEKDAAARNIPKVDACEMCGKEK